MTGEQLAARALPHRTCPCQRCGFCPFVSVCFDKNPGALRGLSLLGYEQECRLADDAAAPLAFDATFTLHDETYSLRLVYVHMIAEYARHNGHADLLRERIDGATGD